MTIEAACDQSHYNYVSSWQAWTTPQKTFSLISRKSIFIVLSTKKKQKRFNSSNTFCLMFSFICFSFGGESWWAQCATRKQQADKLHMLCSFVLFRYLGRKFGFFLGFYCKLIDICVRFESLNAIIMKSADATQEIMRVNKPTRTKKAYCKAKCS